MQNVKLISISAGIGFILSLICGLFSHSSFLRMLLVALLFALIFGILAILISFLYNKFLNLDAVGSDVGYKLSASLAGGNGGAGSGKVDIVISEAELDRTDNNNHYEVGDNRQMLNESDYQSEQDDSDDSKGFVPLRHKENVNNISGTEAAAADRSTSFTSDLGNAKGKTKAGSRKNSSSTLDLPDMSDITNAPGMEQGDESSLESEEGFISDNSDFISSALKYKDDNAGGNIKDASLMAKAISSILSEET